MGEEQPDITEREVEPRADGETRGYALPLAIRGRGDDLVQITSQVSADKELLQERDTAI